MIKLIVSDFDGTLLPYGDASLSTDVKALLQKALDAGKTVVISSGRTYGELLPYVSEFADRLHFLCCDGAYAVYRGETQYERKIETEDLRYFFTQAERAGCAFLLHGIKNTYAVGSVPAQHSFADAIPLSRVDEIPEKIFKITSFCHAIKLPAYGGLRLHWDGGAKIAQYVNRFANKGAALSDLQMRLILEGFDTACLGDSDNDIAMMRGAKQSWCIGERSAALRAVCNRRAPTAAEALRSILGK